MFCFADVLVYFCLFASGHFFGYFCKFTYIYDAARVNWHAVPGVITTLALVAITTLQKCKQRQERFHHFFIIFCGLICYVGASCLMISGDLDICFCVGFIGMGPTVVSCYSFINLRSAPRFSRFARIALANATYFSGLTVGFALLNDVEPYCWAWIYLAISVTLTVALIINEVLQKLGIQDYKKSGDLTFNTFNRDKIIFQSTKTVLFEFMGRKKFMFLRSIRWLTLCLTSLILLDRASFFNSSYMQAAWSSIDDALAKQYLYGPFLLYTIGCGVGTLLMCIPTKILYMALGFVKIPTTAAIINIYSVDNPGDCFPFLCLYYICMGVYAQLAIQLILDHSPFLYTELALAVAWILELGLLEIQRFPMQSDGPKKELLVIGFPTMLLTAVCGTVVQVLMPAETCLMYISKEVLNMRSYESRRPRKRQSREVEMPQVHKKRIIMQGPEVKDTTFDNSGLQLITVSDYRKNHF